LDLKKPNKILYRSPKPIFQPTAAYELKGNIDITGDSRPQVIFCCGAVIVNGVLRIYYGAADSVVCTASIKLDQLLKL